MVTLVAVPGVLMPALRLNAVSNFQCKQCLVWRLSLFVFPQITTFVYGGARLPGENGLDTSNVKEVRERVFLPVVSCGKRLWVN